MCSTCLCEVPEWFLAVQRPSMCSEDIETLFCSIQTSHRSLSLYFPRVIFLSAVLICLFGSFSYAVSNVMQSRLSELPRDRKCTSSSVAPDTCQNRPAAAEQKCEPSLSTVSDKSVSHQPVADHCRMDSPMVEPECLLPPKPYSYTAGEKFPLTPRDPSDSSMSSRSVSPLMLSSASPKTSVSGTERITPPEPLSGRLSSSWYLLSQKWFKRGALVALFTCVLASMACGATLLTAACIAGIVAMCALFAVGIILACSAAVTISIFTCMGFIGALCIGSIVLGCGLAIEILRWFYQNARLVSECVAGK